MADLGSIAVEATTTRADAGRVEVTLRLHIPDGTHIEPHEPPDPLLIPTVAEFSGIDVSSVRYPEPVEKDLGLPGPPLLVYEGTVDITAVGHADESLQVVHGTISYQPCVGGACLPPREQAWQATVDAGSR